MTNPAYPTASPARPRGGRIRRIRTAIGSLLAVALLVTALGLPVGWLWAAVAPRVLVGMSTDGPYLVHPEPEEYIGADGTFLFIGLGLGVLLAVLCWVALRRRRGPAIPIGLALGSLAGSYVAWQFGRRIGLAEYHDLLAHARAGWQFYRPPSLRVAGLLRVFGVPLVPRGVLDAQALAATAVYTLLAGWSRYPTLIKERGAKAADRPVTAPPSGAGTPPAGPPSPGPASGAGTSGTAPDGPTVEMPHVAPSVSSGWRGLVGQPAAAGWPESRGAARPRG